MIPMNGPPTILSLQVGRIQRREPTDGDGESASAGGELASVWLSAIDKRPVDGPVRLELIRLAGDEQADQVHHGGLDKALLAYAAAHYERWRDEHPDRDWKFGGFGENLTIQGQDESTVCVGDRYRIGECVVEVSQPRQPCWKLSRRWRLPQLAVAVRTNGRTGWYLRVLATGPLRAGLPVELLARPYPELSIAWANQVMHDPTRGLADVRLLAACPALAEAWKTPLEKRLANASI